MNRQLPSYFGLAAVLVVSFLALYGPYGYVIAYQSETNDCFFMFGRSFLQEFLDHPAGVLRYAGRFLAQFYHYRWLGTLVVSGCIGCFAALFYGVLLKLKKEVSVWQAFFPCLLLAALHTLTVYVIYDTLGLCASCGAFLVYLWCRGKALRRAYALAATPVLYLILGFYVWFFVVWVAVFEWLDGPARSGLVFKIVYAAVSVGGPLFAWRWLFLIPFHNALICPLMFSPPFRSGWLDYSITHLALDCLLAGLLCLWLLLIPFWGRSPSAGRLAAAWRGWPARRRLVVLAAACSVLISALHVVRYDRRLSTYVGFRQLYNQRQWDALLDKAKRCSSEDLRLQFMTNFALYQRRGLLDEMFHYPQAWGGRGLVFNISGAADIPAEDDTHLATYNSDLFYEMGHTNLAFRHIYDYMYARGRTYEVLKRVAQCSMVNGNYDMAAKYLRMLERTLFHRNFARRYKAIIADPDAAEKEFGEIRERFPAIEHDVRIQPFTRFLMLVETKPDNRMAFDYMTAWLLLDKSERSIATIASYIKQFREVGYGSLPAHCQEALLLLESRGRVPEDLRGFRYDQATKARVASFFRDRSQYAARQDASQHFQDLYGDTYLFYHCYVTTPTDAPRFMPRSSGLGGSLRQE